AVLPPGAFIGLGLLIALKNSLDIQRKAYRKEFKEQSVDKMN
ncbi:MAG: electron transport complex subunit RsxE, partial [Methylococcales bacterium]|nr:electron transport complex subunit RsxE [Methylococcales bacterium]